VTAPKAARRAALLLLVLVLVLALLVGGARPASAAATHLTGTLADGGTWVADVPDAWNGTLLLYSHGYGPLVAADGPGPDAVNALLARGYALVGSSYGPGSWWALGSAVDDQFEALQTVEQRLPAPPQHVLAVGTSMGGLVSALEDEQANGRLDGALTTCGLVGGGVVLHDYQLDQWYAETQLLAPGQAIRLVGFPSTDPPGGGQAAATGAALTSIAQQAQQTPQGRARLALSMAFGNVTTWAAGEPMPAPTDYALQEQQQYRTEFVPPPGAPPFFTVPWFVETARQQMELAAGGNPSFTAGVDFARLFASSPYAQEVKALYREAGLDLAADLDDLTAHAGITADANALAWMRRTSVPTGALQVPELDIHTISDQLIPVQNENAYAAVVRAAGANPLFRQAFVARQGHCAFTTSELVAGVLAVEHRVETGRWDAVAQPGSLNAAAAATGLGPSAFVRYRPEQLTGDNETLPGGRGAG
jgi:hypothetical protein